MASHARRIAFRIVPVVLVLLPFVLHAAFAFAVQGDDEDPVGLGLIVEGDDTCDFEC